MMYKHINKAWLDDQLQNLLQDFHVLKIKKFKNEVDCLLNKMVHQKSDSTVFFTVIMAAKFIELLHAEELYVSTSVNRGTKPRVLDESDIRSIIKQLNFYFNQKIKLFQSVNVEKKHTGTLFDFLVLLEYKQKTLTFAPWGKIHTEHGDKTFKSSSTFLVPAYVAELIRYHYFNLDTQMAKNGIEISEWHSLEQASKLLKKTQSELITMCLRGEIHPYLQLGKFKIQENSTSYMTQFDIDALASSTYLYEYQGYGRLHPEAIKIFYHGADIQVPDKQSYMLIFLKPAYIMAIQGRTKSIVLTDNPKISRKDIVFNKLELNTFLSIKQGKNKLTVDARLKIALDKALNIAKQHKILIATHNMPGTKQDWFQLAQIIDPALTRKSLSTIKGYFKKSIYRFKSGNSLAAQGTFNQLKEKVFGEYGVNNVG